MKMDVHYVFISVFVILEWAFSICKQDVLIAMFIINVTHKAIITNQSHAYNVIAFKLWKDLLHLIVLNLNLTKQILIKRKRKSELSVKIIQYNVPNRIHMQVFWVRILYFICSATTGCSRCGHWDDAPVTKWIILGSGTLTLRHQIHHIYRQIKHWLWWRPFKSLVCFSSQRRFRWNMWCYHTTRDSQPLV